MTQRDGAKSTRSQERDRESHSLVGDLLRRATSPEVLAGVAGAAAAARFTKQAVEDEVESDEPDEPEAEAEEEPEAEGEEDPEAEAEEEPVAEAEEESEAEAEDEPDAEAEGEEQPEAEEDVEPKAEAEAEPEAEAEEEAGDGEDAEPEAREGVEPAAEAENGSLGTDEDRGGLLARARRYAEELTGCPVESFSSLAQEERGWRVGVEVVELRRIPSTTDVLGSYDLVLDGEGDLVDFRRNHRYNRNSTDDGS